MSSLGMQPTFRLRLPASVEESVARMRQAVQNAEPEGHAKAAGSCVDFQVAPDERRFWSPHLSVQLSAEGEGAELFGRFSPRPDVWTMFMMVYFAAAFVAFSGAVYGYVQWTLGSPPWALLAAPFGLAVILTLHVLSFVGQRLSAEQMRGLRGRLDRVVEAAFGGEANPVPPEAE